MYPIEFYIGVKNNYCRELYTKKLYGSKDKSSGNANTCCIWFSVIGLGLFQYAANKNLLSKLLNSIDLDSFPGDGYWDLTLHWHHPLQHKYSATRGLYHHAKGIMTEPNDLKQEVSHILSILQYCGGAGMAQW